MRPCIRAIVSPRLHATRNEPNHLPHGHPRDRESASPMHALWLVSRVQQMHTCTQHPYSAPTLFSSGICNVSEATALVSLLTNARR